MVHWILGTFLALAWISRLMAAARGMPTIANVNSPEWDRKPHSNPRVSIIVPACNEEATVDAALTTLLNLDYENYEVIFVNDRSKDATGEIADAVAATPEGKNRLKVIHIDTLPSGWLGKPHAMWTAALDATGEWLLFTDADVLFKPDSVRRVLSYAENEAADHVVLFPRIILRTVGEKLMIAFFQTLFIFGHRPWRVADPESNDHMGVGAFNFIRRSVYEAIGTYKSLCLEVLDDMKLGKVVKNSGYRQRNVFGDDLISLRWAQGAMGVVRNLTKNFFAIMSFQWLRAVGSCLMLVLLNFFPFVGLWLAPGWAKVPYAVVLVSIFAIYVGMSWHSSVPSYYFFLHPVSTLLFVYTMLRSMVVTLWRGGVVWRGTKYELDELRRGMV